MLCKKPFMRGTVPFGCGQCLPCRINRTRQWTWRQYFESLTHEHNCFVTLTYAPEHYPANGSLEPAELSLFLKRIRDTISPHRVRYFGVGEYGEQTLRPHYHISLFGMSGHEIYHCRSEPRYRSGSQVITQAWSKGHVLIGDFNETTAAYVGGYIVKKLRDRASGNLNGKYPEFSRMSRRPGIGTQAVQLIARSLSQGHGLDLLEETGDVPAFLTIGKRKVPLGRFMLRKLREAVGFTPEYIETLKQKGTYEKSLEMRALFEAAFSYEEVSSPQSAYAKSVLQKIRNTEARAKVFAQKRNL